jgi:DNA-binding NtrC family response regulator
LIVDSELDNPKVFELLSEIKGYLPTTEFVVAMDQPSVEDVTKLIDLKISNVVQKPLGGGDFDKKVTKIIQKLTL